MSTTHDTTNIASRQLSLWREYLHWLWAAKVIKTRYQEFERIFDITLPDTCPDPSSGFLPVLTFRGSSAAEEIGIYLAVLQGSRHKSLAETCFFSLASPSLRWSPGSENTCRQYCFEWQVLRIDANAGQTCESVRRKSPAGHALAGSGVLASAVLYPEIWESGFQASLPGYKVSISNLYPGGETFELAFHPDKQQFSFRAHEITISSPGRHIPELLAVAHCENNLR